MEVPGSESAVVPSPQLTMIEATVPSGSLAVNLTVTVWPARAGFGETLLTFTVGGRSFTVTAAADCPTEPLLSVAVTVIVKA